MLSPLRSQHIIHYTRWLVRGYASSSVPDNQPRAKSGVLMTGASGFMGSFILAQLILDSPWKDSSAKTIHVICRGKDDAEAREKVEELQVEIAKYSPKETGDRLLKGFENVVIHRGDLLDTGFPVPEDVLHTITHSLNLAADTRFHPTAKGSLFNQTGPAKLFENLFHHAPNLQRFVHVGTAYCCGNHHPRGTVLYEDDYPRHGFEHIWPYGKTKAIGELALVDKYEELKRTATRSSLPELAIVRPSIVAGHTTLGCDTSSSIFWAIRAAMVSFGFQYPASVKMDVTPVDYCADATLQLLAKPTPLNHRHYHITSGMESSETIGEMSVAFNGNDEFSKTWPVTQEVWEERIKPFFAKYGAHAPKFEKVMREYSITAGKGLVFDNTRFLKEFPQCAPAPKVSSYVHQCLRAFEEQQERTVEPEDFV